MEKLSKQLEVITDQAIQVIHDFVKATNGSYVNATKEQSFDEEEQGLKDDFVRDNIELFVDTMWNDNQSVYILKITGDQHTPVLHYITEHGTEDSQDILELNNYTICEIADWIIENDLITKTAIEFLQQLPEPIKSEALAEAERQQLKTSEHECHNIECALACCFIWSDSPQGYDYWKKIALNYSLTSLNVQIS